MPCTLIYSGITNKCHAFLLIVLQFPENWTASKQHENDDEGNQDYTKRAETSEYARTGCQAKRAATEISNWSVLSGTPCNGSQTKRIRTLATSIVSINKTVDTYKLRHYNTKQLLILQHERKLLVFRKCGDFQELER